MKRIAIGTLCLLALLFSLTVTARAESLISVTASVDSQKLVTISGKLEDGAGKTVNILVRDPNGSLDYLNTCLSGPGGRFSVSYTMPDPVSGRYSVTVGAAGMINTVATSFLYDINSLEAVAVLEDDLVKVSGTSGMGSGRLITVGITAPDGTEEYAGFTMSGTGGSFSISYTFTNTQTGKYTVRVGASGIEEPFICYFLAGVQTEVKAEIDKQKLVTVEAVTSVPERPVSVMITDPEGKIEYLTSILTQKDGKFSVSYTMMNETMGCYTVSVSTRGLDTPEVTEFFYGTGLMDLKLSSGLITPEFHNEELNYSAVVENSTRYIAVTPTAVNPESVILVNDSIVESGSTSGLISLSEEKNTITITVTEKDETLTAYVLSVTRKAPEPILSTDARLSNLTLTGVSLNEPFSPTGLGYTANVPSSTDSVTVIPYASDSSSTVKVNGVPVTRGNTSQAIALNPGNNTVTVTVTAEAGNTQNYVITVKRAYNTNLRGMQISNGTLSPSFSAYTVSYTASVGSSVSGITVTPLAVDATAIIKVNNTVVQSGRPSGAISLNTGVNTVTVTVTAPDGTSKTYTIAVTRARSNNADLRALSLSAGTLSPAFAASTTNYTVSVGNDVTDITVGIVTADEMATFSVNGQQGYDNNIPYTKSLDVGENEIKVDVKAHDGITLKTYTINIIRCVSDIADLSGIILSSGSISGFDPAVMNYTVNVPNNVSAIRLTPYAGNAFAAIKVNGTDILSGQTTAQIGLTTGSNTISIEVTAQNGINRKNYIITVMRAYNVNLNALYISNNLIAMSPGFDKDIINYTASVAYGTSGVTVTPYAAEAAAVIRVNNTVVTSGSTSGTINLNPGLNTITVTVTAPDGTSRTYTILVTRISTNIAELSALAISEGSFITPSQFYPTNTTYQINVSNYTEALTITPTAAVPGATVTVNDGPAANPVSLDFGLNNIYISVTALDGITTKTYILIVTRPQSTDNTLSALSVSSGDFSPVFSPAVTSYTVNVSNTVNSITITPTLNNRYASVTVDGNTVTSGSACAPIALVAGESRTITICVIPQALGQYKYYIVTVNRAPSANAYLNGLSVTPGSLDFNAETTLYELPVDYSTNRLKVTPTVAEAGAKVKVNGTEVTSGSASEDIHLVVGQNTINVEVTAQDNTTVRTYIIIVTRAPSGNADLSSLIVGNQSISLNASTSYSIDVVNEIGAVTVIPTAADSTAKKIEVNGSEVNSGNASGSINLNVGPNDITIMVTAQNNTTRTYIITVTRAPSGNADLSGITLSTGSLSPAFTADVTAYTVNVQNSVTVLTVTPVPADSTAVVSVNGGTYLAVGENTITITVRAQDEITIKIYTITVTRDPSGNADLSSLIVGSQSISLNASTSYSINVENEVDAVTVTPTAADSTAKKIEVNDTEVNSGSSSGSINLDVGTNTITIKVTAQDNITVKTYTITVIRAKSGNADLSGITLNTGSLSPEFTANVTAYTVAVGHEVNSITMTVNKADSTASVAVIHNSSGFGDSGVYTLGLDVGGNVTVIEVTAQNGTRKTYTVTIERAGSDNANLKSLNVLHWQLDPSFDKDHLNYTIEVYSDTDSIQMFAEAEDSNAEVTINGGSELAVNLDLEAESEEIIVIVTAQDGITTRNYTITVTRSNDAEPIYSIRLDENFLYGRIATDKNTAVAGDTIHLTITPDEGYRLIAGTLKYIDDNGTEYSIANNSFTMPSVNVTITAQFEVITYTVTIDDSISGGNISADKEIASEGETITLTALPYEEGWRLKVGTLKYYNGTEYTLIPYNEGDYEISFNMPAADVTVTAEFEEIPPDSAP